MQKTVPIDLLIDVLKILGSELDHNPITDIPINAEVITWLCERLNERYFTDIAAELAAITEIDEGWTPASQPPDDTHNVMCKLSDGNERTGWYEPRHKKWVTLTPDGKYPYLYVGKEMDANPVVAWRELTEAEK